MSLASQVSALATRIATEFKKVSGSTSGAYTYPTGFSAFSASYVNSLRKDYSGAVTMVFSVQKSSNIAANDVLFTLPTGFIPSGTLPAACVSYGGGVFSANAIYIDSSGNVKAAGGGSFTALFGSVRFQAGSA